jgi:hypothetical protein
LLVLTLAILNPGQLTKLPVLLLDLIVASIGFQFEVCIIVTTCVQLSHVVRRDIHPLSAEKGWGTALAADKHSASRGMIFSYSQMGRLISKSIRISTQVWHADQL